MPSFFSRFPAASTLATLAASTCVFFAATPLTAAERPNIIVIFADDLGYGDLSCQGHPTIATPHLDRMAGEGQRWTQFYSAACLCTPSRAALLTGRLPVRNGMYGDRTGVLFPYSAGGLDASEITIAESLKKVGYATGCVGKWHLGHLPKFLPMTQGFDFYFGLPYSNDMNRNDKTPLGPEAFAHPKNEYFNVPLIRGQKIIERPADQATLTRRYTEEAIAFLHAHRDKPFFLYLAHTMPHLPHFRSKEFEGHSRQGVYGDAIEEIDDGVGRILQTLRELNLDRRTLIVFTSDNGPTRVGSAGGLRGGKATAWEGGMREPCIFWWPGTIRPAVVRQMGSTLDLFATFAALAGAALPDDRPLDGMDLSPALLGTGKSPRNTMFYYRGSHLCAVRLGPHKAHFFTQKSQGKPILLDTPELYHLEHDPSEKNNIAPEHPNVIANINELVREHRANLHVAPSRLEARIPGVPDDRP